MPRASAFMENGKRTAVIAEQAFVNIREGKTAVACVVLGRVYASTQGKRENADHAELEFVRNM